MQELKPCPFCGCSLEKRERTLQWGKTEIAYIHPDNDCIILQWKIVGVSDIAKWNRRADNG